MIELSQLQQIFKILKKNKISKGDVADNLAMSAGYISKILSGKKPITTQFLDSLLNEYGTVIPKTLYMTNKIFLANIKRARTLLGYSAKEAIEKFGYYDELEMHNVERGEIPPPDHVPSNIISILAEMGYIKNGYPNIQEEYIDTIDANNESIYKLIEQNKKQKKIISEKTSD